MGVTGYAASCRTPLGPVRMASDGTALTGLWFEGQKYFPQSLDGELRAEALPVFGEVRRWLELYFSGEEPGFMPPLRLIGSDFQTEVWGLLRAIPYGETTTYGALAQKLARARGLPRLSARAVGGAVGRNPISILVPCHRVVGAGGSLTGYAGGMDRKAALLKLEGGFREGFFVPKTRDKRDLSFSTGCGKIER